MRVHIISDMEGVAGIVKWQQVTGGDPLWDEGRVLYTEEINAAVRGAKAAGATEIVVMDNHGAGGPHSFNSLVHDLLDPACEYVVQEEWNRCPYGYISGSAASLAVRPVLALEAEGSRRLTADVGPADGGRPALALVLRLDAEGVEQRLPGLVGLAGDRDLAGVLHLDELRQPSLSPRAVGLGSQ